MGLLTWLLEEKHRKYEELYLKYKELNQVKGKECWIKSSLIPYHNPNYAYYFRRTIRIIYNNKKHRGKFKKLENGFIVITKKRKMYVPINKVYFEQYRDTYNIYQGNYYWERYTIIMHIEGDTTYYEEMYKDKFRKSRV